MPVKLQTVLGQQCEIYRNLRMGGYSVRHRGKVVGHVRGVILRDTDFIVRPGGRARVLREKRKNVHAFVRGKLIAYTVDPAAHRLPNLTTFGIDWPPVRITYNPYAHSTFVTAEGARPVLAAAWVFLGVPGAFMYVDNTPVDPAVLN